VFSVRGCVGVPTATVRLWDGHEARPGFQSAPAFEILDRAFAVPSSTAARGRAASRHPLGEGCHRRVGTAVTQNPYTPAV
jgi:hypothetical protein